MLFCENRAIWNSRGTPTHCNCVESPALNEFQYCRICLKAKSFGCQTYQPVPNHHRLENMLSKNFLAFRLKSLIVLLLISVLTSSLQSPRPQIFTTCRKFCGGDKRKLTFNLTNHLSSLLLMNSWAGLYKPNDETVKRPIFY